MTPAQWMQFAAMLIRMHGDQATPGRGRRACEECEGSATYAHHIADWLEQVVAVSELPELKDIVTEVMKELEDER